ncbi:hypothetical protein GCM10027286_02380 [Virgibacillus ainsalahensis]
MMNTNHLEFWPARLSNKYPRIVEFLDEFPTTSSGKILWRELQKNS